MTTRCELAMLYVGFLTGSEGQKRIAEFEIDGTQVFFPSALAGVPDFEQYTPREEDESGTRPAVNEAGAEEEKRIDEESTEQQEEEPTP